MDGESVEEVVDNAHRLLPRLRRALLEGSYRPGDIRRVWIPKAGGGQRGLGIPNVIDRWVQQAMLQVLEPIFEPVFHKSSHGFRPNRGAHTAIAEAKTYLEDGRSWLVDIDLSKFFDRVNHQRLLDRLSLQVKDRRVVTLIKRLLKAKVVLPDGMRVSTEEGTPQGGPLSPLLSNVVLDELDWELERRGLCFVRYADDCNIYVGSERACQRVMDSVRRFLEGRLRLLVNEDKSAVEAHKSGSVRGVVGRPAIPTRQIPPAAMRRGSRRQRGCRRRGGYRRYGPVHGRLLPGDGGACFRASVVGFARFTPFQGWWTLSNFEGQEVGTLSLPVAFAFRSGLGRRCGTNGQERSGQESGHRTKESTRRRVDLK